MKTSFLSAVAGLLALAGVSVAQPPGITPEMIAAALPVEGAPLAVAGPYKVTSEPAFGSPGHVVFRPADLSAFPSKDTLPVMAWGNGGCAINSARYSGFFSTIASHGFLVISTVPEPGAPRRQQNADDLRAAIDWAAKENTREGSALKGKIATDQVAVMGQSCGGFLSVALGADPRVKTIGVFNSGVQKAAPGAPPSPFPNSDALPKLHGPVLIINGAERDFMTPTSLATFDMINHVPAFYGARHGAGHTATVDHPGGGEYANVASNWLLWTFKKDRKAAAMFVGSKCDLCTNTNWDVRAKGFPEARVQGSSATFDRGTSQQSWQNPGYQSALAKCKNPPRPFAIPGAGQSANANAAPPAPTLPSTTAIPGVLAAGQTWKVVWSTLYVTNGPAVLAFDVKPDGSLANQREFGKLRGGEAGDGSAVDTEGRVYVATGASVDVFGPDGKFLGSIAGPQGLHGTAFGGRDKKTLFAIVFYGTWGTPSARNETIAIPLIAEGYKGRAK